MFHSYPQKLTLENFIYARASGLKTTVRGENGRLVTSCCEPYLQITVYLYNVCFITRETKDITVPNPWPYGGVKNGWVLPEKVKMTTANKNKFDKI